MSPWRCAACGQPMYPGHPVAWITNAQGKIVAVHLSCVVKES